MSGSHIESYPSQHSQVQLRQSIWLCTCVTIGNKQTNVVMKYILQNLIGLRHVREGLLFIYPCFDVDTTLNWPTTN